MEFERLMTFLGKDLKRVIFKFDFYSKYKNYEVTPCFSCTCLTT